MQRIGYAEDIHRLVADRPLILGHLKINYSQGLLGHSDADVVLHALTEAILGALALGDLGQHFPDNDNRYQNIDSSELLLKVLALMDNEQYAINNIDISIMAEAPRLAEYLPAMRQEISKLCNLLISQVSVKAGTNEGLDAVGRGEAIRAVAVVLLRKKGR